MASSFGAAFRSIWHTMTSYDRHSTFDSPYRTGRHVPLANGRASVLTGVATASDSRHDITSPYTDDLARHSISSREGSTSQYHNGTALSPYTPTSPSQPPYSPGLRSQSARRESQSDGFETQSPGEIPMQSFEDGLAPPPPVHHTWHKIDSWAEENYPELLDQLCEGATNNDLNDLEYQLDCSLPQDVRESLMVHDGQERGGLPTGIIFGSMLLDCEEIAQEWETWRRVNHAYMLEKNAKAPPPPPPKAASSGTAEASSSSAPPGPRTESAQNPMWRQDLIARQDCVPPNAVRRAYAHPAWIPLVRDWGGNNLAVDLAPGPGGKWGQVILFGRDFDTKYVVARSWSAFLGMVADDLASGKWFVDEDSNELKLREFKETRVEPAYFQILRWRMDQKYGRRVAKRKSVVPPNRTGSPVNAGQTSPYGGPSDVNGEPRGRSMHRLSGHSPLVSPIRPTLGGGKSSPLARVAEETALPTLQTNGLKPPKLVEVETPRPSEDDKGASKLSLPPRNDLNGVGKENNNPTATKLNGKQPEVTEEPLRDIEI